MPNVLSKLFTVIIVIVGMYATTLLCQSSLNDNVTQTAVYFEVNEFVDSVCTHGYVSQSEYSRFISKLNSTGLLYDVEITVGHETVVPVFDTQTQADGSVKQIITGTKSSDTFEYTDQILKTLFETDGIYKMSVGDTITVRVTNKSDTLGQKFRQLVLRVPDTGNLIQATAGGVIRDANF